MLAALQDLSAARPHEYRPRGYTPAEWPTYCEGYYCALTMAMKVLDLAYARWKLARTTRRAEAKLAREKTGAA